MRATTFLAGVLAAAGIWQTPSVAQACGGCFGPSETQQVVTDHRMAMFIGARESILWDQIRYSGRPEDFSWVLPVSGDVRVEIASGEFFDTLEALSAVTVRGPFINGSCGGGFGGPFRSSAPSAGEAADHADPVQVVREEVVGPYQTVVLRSTDAGALTTWLRSNAYAIPASIESVIQYYVDRHSDFVALRLRPGEGVGAMQPVRIRYATANMVLPLRMVAAGIADKVGISLWVFGNGRYEAANFRNGQVDPDALVWNWDTGRSNYSDVFNATLRGLDGGRAWLTEYASSAHELRWSRFVPGVMWDSLDADWQLATGGGLPSVWVTKLRTDLAARFLDADLQLQAAAQSEQVSNFLLARREAGTRPEPTCPSSPVVSVGSGVTLGCHAAPGGRGMGLAGGAFFTAALAGAVLRRRRR
jgi:hypothetical protein